MQMLRMHAPCAAVGLAISDESTARALVWKDVYRFFAVGTLEEVCFERQCSKEGLAGEIIDGDSGDSQKFSEAEVCAARRAPARAARTGHSILCLHPLPPSSAPSSAPSSRHVASHC